MSIYYGDSSGKARKIALTGIPGLQGPGRSAGCAWSPGPGRAGSARRRHSGAGADKGFWNEL